MDKFNRHQIIQHGGNGYGHSSGLNRYPKDQLDVIILANNIDVDGERVAGSIASIYEPTVSIIGVSPKPDPNPAFTQRFFRVMIKPCFLLQNCNSNEKHSEAASLFKSI